MRVSHDNVLFGKGGSRRGRHVPWPSFLSEHFHLRFFSLKVHAYTIDVHKPTIMSFELAQLREAAEKYTYHDAGTHWVWPRFVWERRSRPPAARLDDAVEFLGKWKALRFKGGQRHRKYLYNLAEKESRRPTTSSRQGPLHPCP